MILTAQMVLLTTLCGCADAYQKTVDWTNAHLPEVKPGQTISADSKWINSDITGTVDETVTVSEKDDFHTAVNRQWLLDTEVTGTLQQKSTFVDALKAQHELNLELLEKDNTTPDASMISQEEYDHLQSLTSDMADLWTDWETRNEQGAEPIREYIESLQEVNSLEELTAWIVDPDGRRQSVADMLDISTGMPLGSKDQYSVWLSPCAEWIAGSQDFYSSLSGAAYLIKDDNEQAVKHVLGQLGYTEEESIEILEEACRLESMLAEGKASSVQEAEASYGENYLEESYTEEELLAKAGSYPLKEILESMNLSGTTKFSVVEPVYLTNLGRVYKERNLEELKAYYMVKTVRQFLPYLDEESYALDQDIRSAMQDEELSELIEEEKSKQEQTEEEKNQEDALSVEETLISDVLDELFIVRYLNPEDKEFLQDMTEEMLSYYRTMLMEEDWLSEETRQKAVEKLDAMTCRILYPEQLTDFTELQYDAQGTLPDAVNAVDDFRILRMKDYAGQPINKDEWLTETRTTNAMYIATDNSINICAGIIAGGYLYDSEASEEKNFGSIGVIIGHEITHAFDTQGYLYDKDGVENRWWTKEDEESFKLRARKVSKYYSALTPIDTAYNGETVQGEAIADMGGMKCVLGLAKTRDNFDYQEFFRSYATVWRTKNSYYMEKTTASSDVHPLAFLRTNVTVQQFDEFMDAFDIQEGDGMYLAEEDRISVW